MVREKKASGFTLPLAFPAFRFGPMDKTLFAVSLANKTLFTGSAANNNLLAAPKFKVLLAGNAVAVPARFLTSSIGCLADYQSSIYKPLKANHLQPSSSLIRESAIKTAMLFPLS